MIIRGSGEESCVCGRFAGRRRGRGFGCHTLILSQRNEVSERQKGKVINKRFVEENKKALVSI